MVISCSYHLVTVVQNTSRDDSSVLTVPAGMYIILCLGTK